MHNRTDKTLRKPRQIRNTPVAKYVHLISFGLTLVYAGAMYISYRRNVAPFLNDEASLKMIEEGLWTDLDKDFSIFVNNIVEKANKLWKTATHTELKNSESVQTD